MTDLPANIPANYVCECGASNCKLWRPTHRDRPLRCARCACYVSGRNIDTMNDLGQTEHGAYRLEGEPVWMTDQMFNLVPAVPNPNIPGAFYGYTSVPDEDVAWWRALPSIPPAPEPKAAKARA